MALPYFCNALFSLYPGLVFGRSLQVQLTLTCVEGLTFTFKKGEKIFTLLEFFCKEDLPFLPVTLLLLLLFF
jgi:hypothetical protein